MIPEEPTFDDLLGAQQAYQPAVGPHARLVNAMPLMPYEKFAVVCMTTSEFPAIRKAIKEFRGNDFTKWVVFTVAKGIHEWGAGRWSDAFYFSDEVLMHYEELSEQDSNFIKIIIGGNTAAEFLQMDKVKQKPMLKMKYWLKKIFRV